MKTFNHVTSIGIDAAEYNRRLAAGEAGLKKNAKGTLFYKTVTTALTVPTTMDELVKLEATGSKEMTLGEAKLDLPIKVYHFIVGLKLYANQQAQAANRDKAANGMSLLQALLASDPQGEWAQSGIKAMGNRDTFREWAKRYQESLNGDDASEESDEDDASEE